MLQDSRGYIWVGTNSGLNRFDGYGFKVYRHDPNDPNSISSNYILSLYEDEDGIIWVGTLMGGLNRFDRFTDRFTHYQHDPENESSLSHNDVSVIFEDEQKVLWIGTLGGGLNKRFEEGRFKRYNRESGESRMESDFVTSIAEDANGGIWVGTQYGGLQYFDRFNEKFESFQPSEVDENSISSKDVRGLLYDSNDQLWVATDQGLDVYDPLQKTFTHFDDNGLSTEMTTCIFEDNQGLIWLGTQNGLHLYFPETGYFKAYFNNENDLYSISNNVITCLVQDNTGNLWVGTDEGGLNKLDYHSRKFDLYRHDASKRGLWGTNVRAFAEDNKRGHLYVATRGGALNQFDEGLEVERHYVPDLNDPYAIQGEKVMALALQDDGMLWVGTHGQGISKFNPETGQFSHKGNDIRYAAISSQDALCMHFSSSDLLWIGTIGGGLNRLETGSMRFRTYIHDYADSTTLSDDNVSAIYTDSEGVLWVGTFHGLNRFDAKSETFERFYAKPNDPKTISDNYVKSIYEDSNGNLWIGTTGGLNMYDRGAGVFVSYTVQQGLPNDVIYGILEDKGGNLWLSTNKGISQFDPVNETFHNYTTFDGLQGNEFNTGASMESVDGRMFFGGLNGFNIFHPDSIGTNESIPPIVLTGFSIFNKPVELGQGILERDINETQRVELTGEQSVFSLEFAALSYNASSENEYAYKLLGFVDEWSYIGKRRFVTFTNLDPGTYTFIVKGSNNDGIWNEEGRKLIIDIKPEFWQTTWFSWTVAMSLIFLVFLFVQVRERTLRVQRERLELLVSERTAEILREKEGKEVLLKEIHHRVKNNLQVITSLLRLQSYHIDDKKALELFEESQNRVVSMALIHEKIYESRDLAGINLQEYVLQLTENLIATYNLKQSIELDVDIRITDLNLDTLTPIGLILNEVISNAIKYGFKGEEGDTITVHLDRATEDKFRMLVGDNGAGLPAELWEAESSPTLGLELIRTLADQIDGELNRLPRKGTYFELIFSEKISPSLD